MESMQNKKNLMWGKGELKFDSIKKNPSDIYE